MNWWCLREKNVLFSVNKIFHLNAGQKYPFTYQWKCHDRLDSIWWHPMRSLALLCDGTCAKMTIGDPSYAERRTPCPAVRKFLPRNTDIRHELPAMGTYCWKKNFSLSSQPKKIRWDTYAHTIWASWCVDWLTAPTVMSQPGTFHTLHQEIIYTFPLKSWRAQACDQNSKRTLPHKKYKHWQSLERNCTAVEHFQVCTVFCWPYIWDPMISQSTSRPLILWVLVPAMKSMANYLFWDLRKLSQIQQKISNQWQWLRCYRPLRSTYWSFNKINIHAFKFKWISNKNK